MGLKKRARMLAIVLAATMSISQGAVPALAAEVTNIAAEPNLLSAKAKTKTVKITGVKYGKGYVPTKATKDDTINSPSASSNIQAVTFRYSDGSTETVKATNDGVLTLVVDGVQKDILDYVESGKAIDPGKVIVYETEVKASDEYTEFAKFGNMAGNNAQYTNRAALRVDNGKVVATQTMPELLKTSTYDGSGIKGGSLISDGAFFNGIRVSGENAAKSQFTIDQLSMEFNGDGANDFKGAAAGVLAEGAATVEIKDSVIMTEGVVRTAAAAQENGVLKINNSVIYTEESSDTQAEYDALVVPMMKRTPFALGLEGVVRATNILGSAQGIYKDSLIVSSGWGVLSTDSGSGHAATNAYALDVENVTAAIGAVEVAKSGKKYDAKKKVNGVTYGLTAGGSGYVAYADAGVWDKFNNVNFISGDYVQIMASSTSSAFYTNSTLEAGRIAVMTQQNNGGTISIKDSKVKAEDTVVQIKSGAANDGYTDVVLDHADITLGTAHKWGGTLVELVESDDAGNPGNTFYEVQDNGDKAQPVADKLPDSNATLKNGTYTGNIWNNIYNKYEALNVTLDAATVNGTISSSYGYHLNDDGTRMANGTKLNACTSGDYRKSNLKDYTKIGAQYNVANKQINNPVNVSLKNGSTWNVALADGTNGEAAACHVNNLTVEKGCKIEAAVPVTIYVYGEQKIDGTVGANVKIEKGKITVLDEVEDGIAATSHFYDENNTQIKFLVKDEEGNLCKKAVSVKVMAFAYVRFNASANDGYEIVKKEVSNNAALTLNTDDAQYPDKIDNKEGNKDEVTVTITVKKSEGGMPGPGGPGGPGGPEMPGPGSEATPSYKWNASQKTSIAHKLTGSLAKVSGVTAKSSAKKTIKVTFKKAANAKSYKIQYSTSKKFTKKTTKTVTVTKTTKTIKGLKSGKTYYVRVCAVNGSKQGAYSEVKSVKVK